jgi:hypothetical protein
LPSTRRLTNGVALAATFCAAVLSAPVAASAASHPCPLTQQDSTDVVTTMQTMFAAATADDLAKFHTVAAPDFYAYDGGKRFDGDGIMQLVGSLHAAGQVYVWTVTDPHVDGTCHTAWITYVNRGSVTDAHGRQELTWLESAVLQKQNGAWHIRFLHSTRVP